MENDTVKLSEQDYELFMHIIEGWWSEFWGLASEEDYERAKGIIERARNES